MGREVRRAFVADPHHVLLAADYSQIELRVLAHLSEDPALKEAFSRGEDIHRATAALVFGVAPELVGPEQRRAAKTINFGLIYGMGAYALARELGVSNAEAQNFIEAYFARLPKVREYLDRTKEQARETGKVSTLFGRVRFISGLDATNSQVRGNAERQAINAPVQGTAADLMKLAMIRLHRELAEHGLAGAPAAAGARRADPRGPAQGRTGGGHPREESHGRASRSCGSRSRWTSEPGPPGRLRKGKMCRCTA